MILSGASISGLAGAAIVTASLALVPAQAKPVANDAPKAAERSAPQQLASAKTPYFFLVLGVGY